MLSIVLKKEATKSQIDVLRQIDFFSKDSLDFYPDTLIYEQNALTQGYHFVAGVDEVGRGPLAGPVTVAAVILPLDFDIAGITDSKKLTEKKREALYPLIQEKAISYVLVEASPDYIDQYNILEATRQAMVLAVNNLVPRPDFVLIDSVPLSFKTEIMEDIPHQSFNKADSLSVSVAAASVLAKVHRDYKMKTFDILYPEYGFAQHKGYGTKQHYQALDRLGKSPIHRNSFLKKWEASKQIKS